MPNTALIPCRHNDFCYKRAVVWYQHEHLDRVPPPKCPICFRVNKHELLRLYWDNKWDFKIKFPLLVTLSLILFMFLPAAKDVNHKYHGQMVKKISHLSIFCNECWASYIDIGKMGKSFYHSSKALELEFSAANPFPPFYHLPFTFWQAFINSSLNELVQDLN